MSDEAVVAIRGLSVAYGSVLALDAVDLETRPGPIGLLGPNGAGKTTLLKVLLGLLRPGRGRVSVAGHDPRDAAGRLAIRKEVGYMPESDCLVPGMNGVELVSSLGRITGLSRQDAMARAHEVLDYVGIEEQRYRDLTGYSTGMKQRLKLAQALVHDPPLLLLDEPTNGLDPRGRVHMLELIRDLGTTHGKNILLCTHLLPDVERTCPEVVILGRGRVVQSGAIDEMTRADEPWFVVEVGGDPEAFERVLAARAAAWERQRNGAFRCRLPEGEDDADAIFAWAAEAGVPVLGVETHRPTLEDVFVRLVESAGAA